MPGLEPPGFVLVPSALLGPSTWAPVADALTATGRRAVVAVAGDAVAACAELEHPVLVPHSNAGYVAPGLARATGATTVYVDAALPLGGGADTALAPPDFLAFLEGLADEDGLLPPWTGWWAGHDLDGLFPDEATRARVEAEQPRLPLAYFRQRLPVPPGWAERAAGYLAFGDTYTEEIGFARAHGWPVTVLPGQHLHQLHEPVAVAGAVVALAARAAGAAR